MLVSFRHNAYALLRTENNELGESVVEKQLMYHSFEMIQQAIKHQNYISQTDFDTWFGTNVNQSNDMNFWSYYDENDQTYWVHFINESDEAITFSFDSLLLEIQIDNSLENVYQVDDYSMNLLDAESFLSSNKGCSGADEYFDDFAVFSSETISTIELPAHSLGAIEFDLSIYVGIKENHLTQTIKVYPNPASNHFEVDFDQSNSTTHALEIYNELGSLVRQETLFSNSIIDVKNLSSGIYMVVIKSDDNVLIGRQQLVIQ